MSNCEAPVNLTSVWELLGDISTNIILPIKQVLTLWISHANRNSILASMRVLMCYQVSTTVLSCCLVDCNSSQMGYSRGGESAACVKI